MTVIVSIFERRGLEREFADEFVETRALGLDDDTFGIVQAVALEAVGSGKVIDKGLKPTPWTMPVICMRALSI